MFIINVDYNHHCSIQTRHQSAKVERAKEIADNLAKMLPKNIELTVRHHRDTVEIHYIVRGKL